MTTTLDQPITLRAATYNLRKGGLDGLDDSRLRDQVALLADLDPDLIGLQEARWGENGPLRAQQIAAQLGMSYSFIGRSNFYRLDLAVFVRESDDLAVVGTEHLTGSPWVHALTNVEMRVARHPRPVHFLVGHNAPSSPDARLLEAQMATVHRDLDAVYVSDFNAAAVGEAPDATGLNEYKVAKKLDTRAAKELAAAGFLDVGEHRGDPTPTVGHVRGLQYRCDRILTTFPPEWITGFGVVLDGDRLSDHRAVWAEFAIPPN